MPARTLDPVQFYARYTHAQMAARMEWTRLRNAIYVTYPYAKRSGIIINDINRHILPQMLQMATRNEENILRQEKKN